MGQSITIKIAEKTYSLKADSPRSEELIRRAAAKVNDLVSAYNTKFAGRPLADILAFWSLNLGISSISSSDEIAELLKEAGALKEETDAYLKNIEEK